MILNLLTSEKVYFSDGFYRISSENNCFALNKKKLNGKQVKRGDKITLYLVNVSQIIGADINGERCYLDNL